MATGSMIKEVRPELGDKFATSRVFPVDSIDNVIEINKIERVNLINIAINGGEPEAIEGIEKTIIENMPIIWMRYPVEREEKVISHLKGLEYIVYDISMRRYFLSGNFRILWAEYRA